MFTDFTDFTKAVHNQFVKMSEKELYVVKCDDIFERYLAAFPPGTNPIFRARTEHDCQTCKQFIRRLGIVVAVTDGRMVTVWSDLSLKSPYAEVAETLDAHIKSLPIESVFRTKEQQYGNDHNYDKARYLYNHFHGRVAYRHLTGDDDAVRSELNATFQVCKRGLTEIKESDIDVVLELINDNLIYRGQEHKLAIVSFKDLLQRFNKSGRSDLFVWENIHNRNARFRNTVIGTLLTDLAEGKEIEQAVKSFEVKVAPTNYKRPAPIITQKMVEQAVSTLNELGLGGAIYRRFAKFSDVSVNDVLFVDNTSRSAMKDSVTAILEADIKSPSPNLKNVATVTPREFTDKILPGAKSVEVLVENRHLGNFVSLTGSDGPERPFKWDNNFAWSYDGDVTDSIKQRVKAAGGNINADLRVSLSWFNFDDLDLHVNGPCGHVYFNNKQGILDVDMNAGRGTTRNPVENLAFIRPADGVYTVYVNQYMRRETVDIGFKIEVESEGVINQYSYPKAVAGQVHCFDLTVKGWRLTDIKTSLEGGTFSQEKWGVKTETLVPVTSVMYSPNYWGLNMSGAKHLIFALQGCKNPDSVRGIYNEFLRDDLERHRKVFEVLGSRTKCKPSDEQISGVGFTAARGDSVTVVVDRRAYVVKF